MDKEDVATYESFVTLALNSTYVKYQMMNLFDLIKKANDHKQNQTMPSIIYEKFKNMSIISMVLVVLVALLVTRRYLGPIPPTAGCCMVDW